MQIEKTEPSDYGSTAPGGPGRFLSPTHLDFPLITPPRDDDLVEGLLRHVLPDGLRLPETLPPRRTHIPQSGIDSLTSIPPPNLRVVFVLQEMSHTAVAGGGIFSAGAHWQGASPVADHETAGPVYLPLPAAGDTWSIPNSFAIYQALVLGGCSVQTISFPVTLNTQITMGLAVPPPPIIGEATPSDEDTINSAGFYKFSYLVRASAEGLVSEYAFSGLVAVRCVSDTSLD